MKLPEALLKHRAEILHLAEQHGAGSVRVFGSAARGEANAESDIDFLVTFEPGRSLLDHVALNNALELLLQCEVDVVAEGGLSPHLADKILLEAAPL